jgi:ribonuclease HII
MAATGPDLAREVALGGRVAGLDEVGRGAWAGPLMAAAVVLDPVRVPRGIADSKTLAPARRTALAEEIGAVAIVGLGAVEPAEIDAMGLTAANDLAMVRALAALPLLPDAALVDGRRVPEGLAVRAEAVTRGDALSLSIAAASIVAKVARDATMARLAADFPGYGWEGSKGYGTARHLDALTRLGPTPHHRRSFRPVADSLHKESGIA